MNLRMLWATTVALSVIVSRSPGAWAQSSDVVSCPAGWEWNENSLQQDPCLIASMLDATCRSSSTYGIPPLRTGEGYAPPSETSTYDLVCDCDTVMYSLYMACSVCQGGYTYSWIRWASQCDTVYISRYTHEIPHGTAIPQWALYNVTSLSNQTFDSDLAITIGRDPEAKASSVSTIRSSSSTRRPSSSPPAPSRNPVSSTAPSPTGGGSGGGNNNAAIIGGVIGGLVPLIIAAIVAAFYWGRRRSRQRTEQMPTNYRQHPGSPAFTENSTGYPWSTHHGQGYQGGGGGGYTGGAEL